MLVLYIEGAAIITALIISLIHTVRLAIADLMDDVSEIND